MREMCLISSAMIDHEKIQRIDERGLLIAYTWKIRRLQCCAFRLQTWQKTQCDIVDILIYIQETEMQIYNRCLSSKDEDEVT